MIFGSVLQGFKGVGVMVEVDLKRGIPNTQVTGMPRGALLESVDRIRTAIRNSGFNYPQERVLVNLSPASIVKSGTGFDLPIALAVLSAVGLVETNGQKVLAIGELQLSGRLLPVEGILNAVLSLKEEYDCLLIPKETVKASFQDDPHIIEVETLIEAIEALNHPHPTQNAPIKEPLQIVSLQSPQTELPSFESCRLSAEVIGSLAVSAISGMHTFLYGAPGTGKSYSAEFLYGLLPENGNQLSLEVSQIHSAVGEYGEKGFISWPPYRTPHHSASVEGVIGGGKEMLPGEVTLAHGGLLFLDEAPEFKPSILQALREPLERGWVSISRVGDKLIFPADFQLLLSANLCPCGEYGRAGSICICTLREMTHYWNRMGGALFDRIPIRIPFAVNNLLARSIDYEGLRVSVQLLRKELQVAIGEQSYRHCPIEQLIEIFPQSDGSLGRQQEACERAGFSVRQANDLFRLSLVLSLMVGESNIGVEALRCATQMMQSGTTPLEIEVEAKNRFLSDWANQFIG